MTEFEKCASWFPHIDGRDVFVLESGKKIYVDFLNIKSVMKNKKHMSEISDILGKRREFVLSQEGMNFFSQKFLEKIIG